MVSLDNSFTYLKTIRMDIKIDRTSELSNSYNEEYASNTLRKYFDNYSFISSAKIFFRGDKHPTKKVKIQMRLKGKDIFAEGSAQYHDAAFDEAVSKLRSQVQKYKSKHCRKAS
jgi:Ribosome-associated protein Y (PSrp-1)